MKTSGGVLSALLPLGAAGAWWWLMLWPLSFVHDPEKGTFSVSMTAVCYFFGAYYWVNFCKAVQNLRKQTQARAM